MIDQHIAKFLNSPYLTWELPFAEVLVKDKYDELAFIDIKDYNTASALYKYHIHGKKRPILRNSKRLCFLEHSDQEYLANFYEKHGLSPLSDQQVEQQQAYIKLLSAFDLLSLIPECGNSVSVFTNCIQVISSGGPEYDTSYSHPDIPFTIFVSVCADNDPLSNIRVAESILHEAMHLKLTLIQQHIHLVEPGSQEKFYSPWREIYRPLNGVLHGLFVFSLIKLFFFGLQRIQGLGNDIYQAVLQRIQDIDRDFKMLESFPESKGLTDAGRNLAYKLLNNIN